MSYKSHFLWFYCLFKCSNSHLFIYFYVIWTSQHHVFLCFKTLLQVLGTFHFSFLQTFWRHYFILNSRNILKQVEKKQLKTKMIQKKNVPWTMQKCFALVNNLFLWYCLKLQYITLSICTYVHVLTCMYLHVCTYVLPQVHNLGKSWPNG